MTLRADGQATRERILIAASSVVRDRGPAKLTIESAAEAAGLSKGAVLYHFATKDSLIQAMVVRVLDEFDATTDALEKRSKSPQAKYATAYLRATFGAGTQLAESASGLLGAVANNVDLLQPAAQRHEMYQRRLESDGVTPELATLVRLACDGLFFAEAFKLAPPSEVMSRKVFDLLLALLVPPQG
jgi:AcrR family transcriptional regulator